MEYYTPNNTLPAIKFACVAAIAYGSDVKSYRMTCAPYGYGSASLAVTKHRNLIDENPVLISFVDNPVHVTDYYLIKEKFIPETASVS